MNIAEFLEARIAEDEADARGAYYDGQRWYSEEEFVGRYPDCCDCGCEVMMGANRKIEAAHIARWQPSRTLAECAAKRAIVGDHIEAGPVCMPCEREWPCPTLRHLAAVYSDHPDYQQGWVA